MGLNPQPVLASVLLGPNDMNATIEPFAIRPHALFNIIKRGAL
jgi:hypothetical protein